MQFTIEQIARIAHEANRAYCESIGDHTQPRWSDAADWQRKSAMNGVGFHLTRHGNGITPLPSASHEAWLAEKRADGWKYGPVKDPAKKEHPCFVAYDELPFDQRMKDHLFAAICATFARFEAIEPITVDKDLWQKK